MCIAKVQPTVVVMGINMSRMDGIAATRFIKAQYPQIAVVGFSVELKDYRLMQKAGASDVVSKENVGVELYGAIQRAVAGIDGKAIDRPEISAGLGSMTEAT